MYTNIETSIKMIERRPEKKDDSITTDHGKKIDYKAWYSDYQFYYVSCEQ